MLPYTPDDPQQLARKRHLGNDVVVIIFQEVSQFALIWLIVCRAPRPLSIHALSILSSTTYSWLYAKTRKSRKLVGELLTGIEYLPALS